MRLPGRTTIAGVTIAAAVAVALAVHAQTTAPINVTPSRDTLEQAARDSCDNTSVVVQRCLEQQHDATGAPTPAPADELTRSRERAKDAFDRRTRQQQKQAMDGKSDAAPTADGEAQRLAPVTVTGAATADPPPQPEEVIQKALDPRTNVLANGNTVTYGPDGERTECQAHCVGPMCCKVVRALPNPARLSNSIGQ